MSQNAFSRRYITCSSARARVRVYILRSSSNCHLYYYEYYLSHGVPPLPLPAPFSYTLGHARAHVCVCVRECSESLLAWPYSMVLFGFCSLLLSLNRKSHFLHIHTVEDGRGTWSGQRWGRRSGQCSRRDVIYETGDEGEIKSLFLCLPFC